MGTWTTGGQFEFGECRIHPADIRLMYDHSDPERRFGFCHERCACQELWQRRPPWLT